jgi:hypothetical protein
MELHRRDRTSTTLALVGLGYFAVAAIVGGLFAWGAGRVHALSVILWVSGGFFGLLGLIVLVGLLKRFQITFDEQRLVVHVPYLDFEGPWDRIERITLEEYLEGDQPVERLVLWLPGNTPTRHRPDQTVGSAKGFNIAEPRNLAETRAEVVAALHRCAGPRFRNLTHADRSTP